MLVRGKRGAVRFMTSALGAGGDGERALTLAHRAPDSNTTGRGLHLFFVLRIRLVIRWPKAHPHFPNVCLLPLQNINGSHKTHRPLTVELGKQSVLCCCIANVRWIRLCATLPRKTRLQSTHDARFRKYILTRERAGDTLTPDKLVKPRFTFTTYDNQGISWFG